MRQSKTIGINSSANHRGGSRFARHLLPVLALVSLASSLYAGEKNLSVSLRGTYTTTSRIFLNPDAATEEQRAQIFQLDGIIGGGVELRYQWPGELFFFTLSFDFLSRSEERYQFLSFSPARKLPVTEGLRLMSAELGMHTYIPVGWEDMRVSMGGGIGMYRGERIFRVAGVEAAMQNAPVRFGIHVSSGVEYRVLPGVWMRGEMRFRDPEFRAVSRFTEERTVFDGATVTFPQNEFSSKVNVHGIVFSFGVAVELW